MKKVIAFIVLTAGLTACTKTETVYVPATEAPEQQSTATFAQATTPATTVAYDYYQTDEQIFLDFVYGEYPYPIYVSDADLIATGYAVCDALDAGVPPYAIVSEMLNAAGDDENTATFLSVVTGGATGILCPEYVDVWTN